MNLIFCQQINTTGFFKLILSFQICVARHAQITQNNMVAISLQYFEKELSDEIDFLDTDKHENFLQIDTMILMGMTKHSQSSKNSKFTMSCKVSLQYPYSISKKKLGMEFIFYMQINIKAGILVFDESDQTCPKYQK